jgi:hypothetical protein
VTGKRCCGVGEGEQIHPETGGLKPQDSLDMNREIPGDVPKSLKYYGGEEKMKKLLIGFLAVGLIMSFAMTASAQPNIKASGQLYMYGTYTDNQKVINNGDSRANIANRMRIQFEIQVQEGLKLTTRFDAMERAWGEQQVAPSSNPGSSAWTGAAAAATERNISWERAYVTFNALYGVFDVGYQQSRVWGTCAFCDDYDSDAGIHYRYMMGPWTFGLEYEKRADTTWSGEGSGQGGTYLGGTDNDHDVYHIYAIYRWATGQAGLRYEFDRDATGGKFGAGGAGVTRQAPYGLAINNVEYVASFNEIAPYVQWVAGPFSIESELRYIWGKTEYNGPTTDVDRKGWSFYANGKYTMGAWYGGLEFAYITGDDPATTDKNEAGVPGGQAWDPMLIYGNYWNTKYQGAVGQGSGVAGSPVLNGGGGNETNLIMFKPYVGWKVNPQLEVVLQYAWLKAAEKPTGFASDDYGQELDIYATYKLYNNLSYTVGFGYFMTGDYFKGTNSAASLDDNFLVMNALNFAF